MRSPDWPAVGHYDLFGGRPPSVNVDTSREAMTSDEATAKARIVLSCIRCRGQTGMTCDEVEAALMWPHQTVSARLRELELKGHLRKTETKRKTRTGRNARVYVWEGS